MIESVSQLLTINNESLSWNSERDTSIFFIIYIKKKKYDSAVNLSGVKLKCLFSGHYFIVEDDVRELAQMKVDKRFQGILNMLRHCQRFREVRGGGITRFLLL